MPPIEWLETSSCSVDCWYQPVETYNYLKHQNNSIIKGFDDAGISEAITCATNVFKRLENPFDEQRQQRNF